MDAKKMQKYISQLECLEIMKQNQYFIKCQAFTSLINTHQVIDAQEEGLDAAIALAIPAGRDAQIYPHQLRQEL